ncbi:sensor histidine kinase [Vibrio sinensis]|uniref:histidine kinase n=1 Tax=Vibrio sinensis TaxID=2302434 RepID=A0A3A6QQM9_9VIBR|nr:HAMP domain-containing sensor histidine kinase [Vibrio sinensis]RJX73608.1 sensor histidine kinase [Vibrio sinensis]
MINRYLAKTPSLTGRLAVFFTFVSCIVGIVTFLIFYTAIQWSEDRVGERRILIDKDTAIERFSQGEQGEIRIDALTVAYNDLSLVPKQYQPLIAKHDHYLGEVGLAFDPLSHMVFKGQYTDQGIIHDLVLLSLIDKVEFNNEEIVYSGVIVIGFVSILMFIFGTVLHRLSKRLIEPLNSVAKQLEDQSGDTVTEFTISPQASEEFQILTQRLNTYRHDACLSLKREQAFARYASHELRTPLTIVKGASKLLSRGERSEFQSRQINRIDDATRQMVTMVDTLMSIVRYERNVDDAPLRTIHHHEISQIIAANAQQAQDKQIDIELIVQSEPQLRATQSVLNMIVGNLIRNAIAATSQGKITVQVTQYSIEVIDDGCGVNLHQQDHQLTSQGHGLGLLIVDDLSQRYGWSFTLTNHQERGGYAKISFDNQES